MIQREIHGVGLKMNQLRCNICYQLLANIKNSYSSGKKA